jgi:hypothetical protein
MKKLTEGSEYDFESNKLHVYIADNSEYDLDNGTVGSIVDPLVIAEVSSKPEESGGGDSSGCNTGLGLFAFAFALPLAAIALKRRPK